MVYKRHKDKNKIKESDPNMKRWLDPDIARRKQKYWAFADKLKNIYPNAVPLLRLKSKEMCDQCEVNVGTRKVRIQKSMSEHMDALMCETCYPTLVSLCQLKGFRLHVLDERTPY